MAEKMYSKETSVKTDVNEDKKRETRVVGVVSGKGGVGKTTFSANLGIALNAFDKKTLIVDCNVTTPHLSYYMGVKNFSSTINNIFAGELDARFAPLDQNGVMFIPASERFEDLKRVNMKTLKNIIQQIVNTKKFDFIILDSAPGLGREAMGTLQACNEIIFITTPTAPNVMDIARCDEVARMLGHRKFYLVLNMVRGKAYELWPEKAEELFDMPVIGWIPFDENVMDSTAEGVPIMWYKPESRSCDHFMFIAARLAGINLGEEPKLEEEFGEKLEGAEGREETFSETVETLEPIIETANEYYYSKKEKKSGFRSRLRHKIDDTALSLANKIKDAIKR